MGKSKVCSDECDYCIYIGEGDYICDLINDIVITDFVPIYGICISDKEQKGKK